MSRRLKEIETEVERETSEVIVAAQSSVDSARATLSEIPDAMICNGVAEARRSIISLLDRCDDHFLSAMQSIHAQYGKNATTETH